jgi:spore coat protein U-like protein
MDVKCFFRVITVLVLWWVCSSSWAGTATTTFAVSATVINNCSITATPLAFGNYDPTSVTDTAGTNTVSVTCTGSAAYAIALNGGATSGSTIAQRKMADTANHTLNYGLYQDSGHTVLWGDGTTGTKKTGTGTSTAQNYVTYGVITHAQAVPAGAYTDTITATITF